MGESEKLGKKNVILAILAMILVGIIVLIVLNIIRQPNQVINPFFKVTYNVIAVDARVQATYQEEGSLTQKYFKNLEDNGDYVDFTYKDNESTTKALSMTQELELREYESHYVLFTYKFTNRNHNRYLNILMKDECIKENVTMYYATSKQVTEGYSFVDVVEQVQLLNQKGNTIGVTCDKATSESNTEVIIYALFTITNEHDNGTYQTTSANQMIFELTSSNYAEY